MSNKMQERVNEEGVITLDYGMQFHPDEWGHAQFTVVGVKQGTHAVEIETAEFTEFETACELYNEWKGSGKYSRVYIEAWELHGTIFVDEN